MGCLGKLDQEEVLPSNGDELRQHPFMELHVFSEQCNGGRFDSRRPQCVVSESLLLPAHSYEPRSRRGTAMSLTC